MKQELAEEIIFPPKERNEILNKLRQVLFWKWKHYKIFKLLNDSSVLKFVTKPWIEVNDLSTGQYSANKIQGLRLQC